jgi:hypothetical protein
VVWRRTTSQTGAFAIGWRAVVNIVVKLQVPQNACYLLSKWVTVQLQHHELSQLITWTLQREQHLSKGRAVLALFSLKSNQLFHFRFFVVVVLTGFLVLCRLVTHGATMVAPPFWISDSPATKVATLHPVSKWKKERQQQCFSCIADCVAKSWKHVGSSYIKGWHFTLTVNFSASNACTLLPSNEETLRNGGKVQTVDTAEAWSCCSLRSDGGHSWGLVML